MFKNIKKILKLSILGVFLFGFSLQAQAEILWQENFDSQADWQLEQPQHPAQSLSAWQDESTIPPNFNMYYIRAYEIDENQHNSIIISSENAKGGAGKAATFWNESCSECSAWQSDNQIGTELPGGDGHEELWIQSYIKFDPTWQFSTTVSTQHKMGRVAHLADGGNPFAFFQDGDVRPIAMWGLSKWGGGTYPDSMYSAWRYENIYYPDQATPDHSRNGTENFGANNLYDNQWHKIVYRVKMNSSVGVADGIYEFYIDDVLLQSEYNLAYSDNGARVAPRKKWNEVGFGGNSLNKYASRHDNAEQWYALDDLCITTAEADLASCFSGVIIRADVDQNSTINSTDAMLTLRNSLGLDMSSTNWQASSTTGDVNCDDSANSTDALLILRDSLGLDMSGTGWCGN